MKKIILIIVVIILATICFFSCNRVPRHARYIPDNAAMVLGINIKGIGKKIAWNAIIGSDLLDELSKENKDIKNTDALKDVENAGIDVMNTMYVYGNYDDRFSAGVKLVALVPIDDAKKWEAFAVKTFKDISIKEVDDRKEAFIADNIFISWNKNVLAIMNAPELLTAFLPGSGTWNETTITTDTVVVVDEISKETEVIVNKEEERETFAAQAIDTALLSEEMKIVFATKKENSLIQNKRFTRLEKEGHHISLFVNYGNIMNDVMRKSGQEALMMSGIANTYFKNSDITAGVDFEKGAIDAVVKYYASDSLKPVMKGFGNVKNDKEMLERLPKANTNFVLAWHLAPDGIKKMYEKLGIIGLVDMYLASQGLSAAGILSAFSGDVALSVNNFKIGNQAGSGTYAYADYTPVMDYIYAIKKGDKNSFNTLWKFIMKNGGVTRKSDKYYAIEGADGIVIAMDDNYVVIASKEALADAYLKGDYKKDKYEDNLPKNVLGHPFGAYVDINTLSQSWNMDGALSEPEKAMIAQTQNLFDHISVNGGEFKGGAVQSHFSLKFKNSNENSLIILLDYAAKMKKIQEQNIQRANAES